MLAKVFYNERRLHCKFSVGHEDECLDCVDFCVNPFNEWDAKCGSLASTVLCFRNNISALQNLGNCFFLNRGGGLKAHFVDTLKNMVSKFTVTKMTNLLVGVPRRGRSH